MSYRLPARVRSVRSNWPPYDALCAKADGVASTMARLERLYHVGQDHVWDGREVLGALIAKHGRPHFDADKQDAVLRLLAILLWGELAAWAISAELAMRIEDPEAKMAATSQAHDEARHFYVLRDYLRATGYPVPKIGGLTRNLLVHLMETPSLVHKLIGMQILVESNALGIFKALREAAVEPVLCELLPYYERDEARHVGLGVLYLPPLLRNLGRVETAKVVAFQARCLATLLTGGLVLREDLTRMGIDSRKATEFTVGLQKQIFNDMAQGPRQEGERKRDRVRGLLGVGETSFLEGLVDFVYPKEPLAPWHETTLALWTRAGAVVDRALA